MRRNRAFRKNERCCFCAHVLHVLQVPLWPEKLYQLHLIKRINIITRSIDESAKIKLFTCFYRKVLQICSGIQHFNRCPCHFFGLICI